MTALEYLKELGIEKGGSFDLKKIAQLMESYAQVHPYKFSCHSEKILEGRCDSQCSWCSSREKLFEY